MARNSRQLMHDIRNLERRGFKVESSDDFSWVHVMGLELPSRGVWTENKRRVWVTSVLISIPPSWPSHPPGVGLSHPSHAIHIPDLAYNRKGISDLHSCDHAPWHWLCFEEIIWKPEFGLVGLMKIIERTIWERAQVAHK